MGAYFSSSFSCLYTIFGCFMSFSPLNVLTGSPGRSDPTPAVWAAVSASFPLGTPPRPKLRWPRREKPLQPRELGRCCETSSSTLGSVSDYSKLGPILLYPPIPTYRPIQAHCKKSASCIRRSWNSLATPIVTTPMSTRCSNALCIELGKTRSDAFLHTNNIKYDHQLSKSHFIGTSQTKHLLKKTLSRT